MQMRKRARKNKIIKYRAGIGQKRDGTSKSDEKKR